jgi:hypothetical protein
MPQSLANGQGLRRSEKVVGCGEETAPPCRHEENGAVRTPGPWLG